MSATHRAAPLFACWLVTGWLAGCGETAAEETGAEPAGFAFVDVAAAAGIDEVVVSGDPRRWYIPESNGSGAAWLDYDGDGDQDLFLGNGAALDYGDDGIELTVVDRGRTRLYRNEGGMRFTDVSEGTGAARADWVQAIATGDVDADGDPDLYLACFGEDVLLVNEGGTFVDRTAQAGLGNDLWAAGAAFGDADGDGDLDLYVANYCLFDLASPPDGGKRAVVEGVEVAWGPEGENDGRFNHGAPDVFYRGDGEGGFVEATTEAGLALEKDLCSYAVVFSDVTGDGHADILVANDIQPANLFVGAGDGTFKDEALERGFAFDGDGKPTSAMGLAVEDFDGDGDFDVLRTNFDFEPNSLHVNDGEGRFTEAAARFGLAEPTLDRLGWGGGFFDADCDGDLDVLVANGHVYPQGSEIGMGPWLQVSQLFEARTADSGRVSYHDVTADAGADLGRPRSARGVAFADADDDGDVDVLVVDLDEAPRLLENRTPRRGRWISVRTRGAGKNTDALGALVTVEASGRAWTREVRTTQGLYSSHDPRLHFGLGDVQAIERVVVRWPSGAKSEVDAPPLDAVLVVEEPAEVSR